MLPQQNLALMDLETPPEYNIEYISLFMIKTQYKVIMTYMIEAKINNKNAKSYIFSP